MLGWMILAACGADEPGDTGPAEPQSACGEPSTVAVTVVARVVDPAGGGVKDIRVALDDRGWTFQELAEGTTDRDGYVTLEAVELTDLPGCWGTVLDYVLVASDPKGHWETAEKDVNSWLYNAISDGTGVADLSGYPIEIGPAR